MTKLEETLAAAIEAIDDAIIEQADSLKPSEHGVRERRDKFFDDIAVKPDDFYISLVNDYGRAVAWECRALDFQKALDRMTPAEMELFQEFRKSYSAFHAIAEAVKDARQYVSEKAEREMQKGE